MRAILTAAVVCGGCLLSAGAASAGVYNTAEPLPDPTGWKLFQQFQSALGDLRGAAVERPGANPLRERYLKQVAELEAKERASGLTVTDRVNLGACYLRLMRYEDAVRVLDPAVRQEPENFLALANLATATHQAGPQDPARLSRAIEYQTEALKAWPQTWPANQAGGCTPDLLIWYRRAERYYLALLRLRQQEVRLQAGRGGAETPDDLFHVRFVGPSGHYEAGAMEPEEFDKLPLERVPLVTQLLVWLPLDNRLYWQQAELLNAQGDIPYAGAMMDELVYSRNYGPPELKAHRQVVREAVSKLPPAPPPDLKEATPAPAAPAAAPPAPAAALPDWRPFVVGLVTGAVIAFLIGQQLRQSRSRKVDAVRGAG
jgi:tetratricopeptide (TPR) repeat protein